MMTISASNIIQTELKTLKLFSFYKFLMDHTNWEWVVRRVFGD